MNSINFVSDSLDETREVGRLIGNLCQGGECLLLHGPLGAGKTCLVKGLAGGLGIEDPDQVVSPTFVIHIQYFGRLEFNHIDAYRLGKGADVSELGFDELIDGNGVTAVEWAEYIEKSLPEGCLEVEIEMLGAESRSISVKAPDKESPASRLYDRLKETSPNRL